MSTFNADRLSSGVSISRIFNPLQNEVGLEHVQQCSLQSVTGTQSVNNSISGSDFVVDQQQDQMLHGHFDSEEDLISAESIFVDREDLSQGTCENQSPTLDGDGIAAVHYIQQLERESDNIILSSWNMPISYPATKTWSNSESFAFTQSVLQEPPGAAELFLSRKATGTPSSSVVSRQPIKSVDLGFGPLFSATPLRANDRSIVSNGQAFAGGSSSLHLPHDQMFVTSKPPINQRRVPLSSMMVHRGYSDSPADKLTSKIPEAPSLFPLCPGISYEVCVLHVLCLKCLLYIDCNTHSC